MPEQQDVTHLDEGRKVVDGALVLPEGGETLPPLPSTSGFPFDWYWERDDGTLFHSARIQTVSDKDEQFVEWLVDGRVPTAFPKDPEGNDSVEELQAVLDAYNLHATLEHYAGGVRYAKVQEPLTVPVAGKSYRFQTDEESTAKLSATVQLGGQYEAVNGEGSFSVPWKTADGFTDAPLSLSDLKGVGLALGMNEAGLFAKEAAAVAGLADGSITDKAGVEAVFAAPIAAARTARKTTAKTAS